MGIQHMYNTSQHKLYYEGRTVIEVKNYPLQKQLRFSSENWCTWFNVENLENVYKEYTI